jgi:transcriptional regulator GlxA family with amidase domain
MGVMHTLALVVFDGVQSLDVAGPLDVFAEANTFLPRHRQYALSLVGVQAGSVRCSNGMALSVPFDYQTYTASCDLLLVAGGPRLPDAQLPREFLAWLRAQAQNARRFGSVCNGVFLLAQAGLLEGKEVTTHWSDARRLTEQFPGTSVVPDKIYVRDGRLFTSAGVTAGIDLCLSLVAEDWGFDLAMRVAKRLVVYLHREGGQSQYSPFLAAGPANDTLVNRVLRYVTDHISEVLSIEQLADAVAVSRRTFSRTFAKNAHVTPAAFVEQVRVDHARKLLEDTDDPLKTVAYKCGFHSTTHMRMIFSRRLDTTPRQYRQRFREPRNAGELITFEPSPRYENAASSSAFCNAICVDAYPGAVEAEAAGPA